MSSTKEKAKLAQGPVMLTVRIAVTPKSFDALSEHLKVAFLNDLKITSERVLDKWNIKEMDASPTVQFHTEGFVY